MKKAHILKMLAVVVILFLTWYFGFRLMFNGEGYGQIDRDKLKDISTGDYSGYSVVVVGEEPDGIAAAISSARTGLKTLLITDDITLGGEITDCLIAKTYQNTGQYLNPLPQKRPLNIGIYKEIFDIIGQQFVPEEYAKIAKELVDDEKNLDVMYSAGIYAVDMQDDKLNSISVYYNGNKLEIEADIFIDSTVDGDLLNLCGGQYFTGSEDLNAEYIFDAVSLNFIISGVEWEEINKIQKTTVVDTLYSLVQSYEKQFENTQITEVSFISQPDNKILISGLSMSDVDVNNRTELELAYDNLFYESQMFTAFLKTSVKAFENCQFDIAAPKLYIPENKHYYGRYMLTVTDVLENKNFETKIALSSRPINGGKFIDSGICYIGMPEIFSIPVDCIISKDISNLLMTGRKASYSSLASTAVNDIGTSMTIGESAAYTAFFCITNGILPAQITSQDIEIKQNYNNLLKRFGVFLDEFDYSNPNEDNISYPALKVLCEYGLLVGGSNNDYGFNIKATNSSLVNLILNSLYRIAPKKYSLELENKLREYDNDNQLTLENASKILLTLHGENISLSDGDNKKNAIEYIPEILNINEDDVLEMEEVYYITIYNIEIFSHINLLE